MISKDYEKIQNWISRLLNDPLVEILLNNSHLSKIQLETYLIDILAEEIVDKRLKYEDKARFRQRDKEISRGAFNRTLKQAKRNTNRSINTILLLGYLGIFNSSQLQKLIEFSEKLNLYVKTYAKVWNKQKKGTVKENTVNEVLFLKKELENSLKRIMFK